MSDHKQSGLYRELHTPNSIYNILLAMGRDDLAELWRATIYADMCKGTEPKTDMRWFKLYYNKSVISAGSWGSLGIMVVVLTDYRPVKSTAPTYRDMHNTVVDYVDTWLDIYDVYDEAELITWFNSNSTGERP